MRPTSAWTGDGLPVGSRRPGDTESNVGGGRLILCLLKQGYDAKGT